jgi:chromosome segregation ATPase
MRREKTVGKVHPCPLCGFRGRSKFALAGHMRTHRQREDPKGRRRWEAQGPEASFDLLELAGELLKRYRGLREQNLRLLREVEALREENSRLREELEKQQASRERARATAAALKGELEAALKEPAPVEAGPGLE